MHELKIIHRGIDNQWYCVCGRWHYLQIENENDFGAIDGFIEHIDKATPVK